MELNQVQRGKKKNCSPYANIKSRLDFNQTVLSRTIVMRPLKRFLNHNKGEQMFCYGMYFFIKYQRKKRERKL